MKRIMSFNIRCADVNGVTWQQRKELVSKQILEAHPDSVGLQEAHTKWMRYLARALKSEYAYVGVGRENGRRSGEFSSIFYLKDKYEAVESGNFWLSQTPKKPSRGWDASCKRICTWVRLREKETGKEYVHINTHFDHKGETAQRNSVGLIHDKAKEFKDIPTVFTADLNIFEGGEIYNDMVSDVLKDAKLLAPDTMNEVTYHNGDPEHFDGKVIDFVLVNPLVVPKTYRVLTQGIDGQLVSDHYPIYADCEF